MGHNDDLILAIDDVEENLVLLTRILSKDGYRVKTTTNSKDLIPICQSLHPSLVLMDIKMPGSDGITLCKQLKGETSTSSIPVIFMSALESTEDRLQAFKAGAVDYIVKPFEIRETLARVSSQISIHRLQKELETANTELDKRLEELNQSQLRLKEREAKLNGLIKALPNMTFVYDEKGTYLEIFSNEYNFLIAPPSEMLGKNISEFLPPDVVDLKMKAIQAALLTEQTQIIEYQMTFNNGHKLWFEGRIALLAKTGSGEGQVICVTNEITERKELYEQIEQMAIYDSLTSCYNRRHFINIAEKEISRANRYSRPLSLMIVDVDHFKNINDTFGHPTGDEILKQFVDLCKSHLRSADVIGRYGGEEFCFLFPETDADGAVKAAEKIRKYTENFLFRTSCGDLQITISAGVACLDSTAMNKMTLVDLFIASDKALYMAKKAGRNKVMMNCSATMAHLVISSKSKTHPLQAFAN